MSWLFSQAAAAAFLAGTCSDGEPCAQWSVMPTAHPFWRRDKTMDFSQPFPSGRTFAVLTAGRGQELLTSYPGGFPCQDISAAGKGAGIDGERSSLWKHMARIVGEVRPSHVFVENSPMLASRGLGTVLGDLATLGFDARWGVLGAAAVGFAHDRERIWVAASHPERGQRRQEQHDGPDRRVGWLQQPIAWDRPWLDVFTRVRGDGDGMADRLDRTDAIRNGQVPAVAATAWRLLSAA